MMLIQIQNCLLHSLDNQRMNPGKKLEYSTSSRVRDRFSFLVGKCFISMGQGINLRL